MRLSKTVVLVFFAMFCLGQAGSARAEGRHFQASQSHFESMAAQAAALSGQLDALDQKSICAYYAATAATYAVRAHALAQLATVADKVRTSEDKGIVLTEMAKTRAYVTSPIESDLKVMENLSGASHSARLKDLGVHLMNELRVFAHNAHSATGQ